MELQASGMLSVLLGEGMQDWKGTRPQVWGAGPVAFYPGGSTQGWEVSRTACRLPKDNRRHQPWRC